MVFPLAQYAGHLMGVLTLSYKASDIGHCRETRHLMNLTSELFQWGMPLKANQKFMTTGMSVIFVTDVTPEQILPPAQTLGGRAIP